MGIPQPPGAGCFSGDAPTGGKQFRRWGTLPLSRFSIATRLFRETAIGNGFWETKADEAFERPAAHGRSTPYFADREGWQVNFFRLQTVVQQGTHSGMAKPIAVRFSVLPENEEAAVAYVDARGYSPARIERNEEGLTVLIFPPLADGALERLVKAMPVHLNAKIGIVVGGASPFTAPY